MTEDTSTTETASTATREVRVNVVRVDESVPGASITLIGALSNKPGVLEIEISTDLEPRTLAKLLTDTGGYITEELDKLEGSGLDAEASVPAEDVDGGYDHHEAAR